MHYQSSKRSLLLVAASLGTTVFCLPIALSITPRSPLSHKNSDYISVPALGYSPSGSTSHPASSLPQSPNPAPTKPSNQQVSASKSSNKPGTDDVPTSDYYQPTTGLNAAKLSASQSKTPPASNYLLPMVSAPGQSSSVSYMTLLRYSQLFTMIHDSDV